MAHRRRTPGALVASGLILAATACGGGAASDDDTGGGSAAADELVVAYSQDIDTLDPHQFKTDAGYGVVGNIYGTLLQEAYTDGGDGVLSYAGESAPFLAESATWDDPQTTLTFVLKDGLTFAGGEPVTSEDVVWSLQRALSDVGYVQAIGQWLNVTDPATDIVATDERTVELHVTHYSPLIEQFLAFQIFAILDKSAVEAQAGADDPWGATYLADEATASGPYAVESRVPGQSMTLTQNTEYTAGDLADAPGRIVVQSMPDPQQAFLALQNGAVDVIFGMTPDTAQALEQDPGLRLYDLEYSLVAYVGFNYEDPALQDVKVRQALSYLMPYEALREDVMKGYAGAAYGAVPYPMRDALDETGEKVAYPTDVEKAQELLAEAGFGPGELSLTLSVPASDEALSQSAVFIQSALQEGGVNIEVNEMSDADYNENLGSMQLFLDSWYSWGQDSVYQMFFLLTSGVFTNYTNFSNAEVDELVRQAMATSDPDERRTLSQQAQQLIIDEAPWAFLFTRDYLVGAREGVEGITHSNDANLRFDQLRVTS
ncbi:ABC transporter substrate-binding protein [Jiangella alba]|uniref:Peptide/nickel transport system substrate-binding protein n=1 Tax=Jiangella alba TaxID=561176 RepID=A0A1H5KV26_9ACTN|nr:ABC transporter substrate-binding protein [Jiangella alba]SEE68583.1 peptide/nickel transport system substrate-binding protein [Jiangella alba]